MAALRDGDAPMRFHAIHRRSDGGNVSVEVNAARIPSVEGGLVVEVIRDLDAMMQVSHEQRLSELGQLATGVAHEIRNPLSCAAILLREDEAHLASLSSVELSDAMTLIRREIDRCLAITDSLLKLGAPPASEPELVELNGVVAEMAQFLRYQAESAHVTLAARLEGRLRVLASDSDIRVVFINLVQNALHAMPGGGALQIIGARAGEGKIVLKITDTGIGVPPEHLKSIFLPFWSRRADGVRGTGLGLSICRSLVRAAGGEINVSSVLGEGTTFSVELPDADFDAGATHGD
jgi:signal transduction histidine kinase